MKDNMKDVRIAVCGTGFVGGNLADNLEDRGFANVARYSLEPEYAGNARLVGEADLVFVAVPTPYRHDEGFDGRAVEECLRLCSPDALAAVRSTMDPRWLRDLHGSWAEMPRTLYCPEFLDVDTARMDTDMPERNVVGVRDPHDEGDADAAAFALNVLPRANFDMICTWEEAAMAKYGGNCFFTFKNAFFNILERACAKAGADYETVRMTISADPRIGPVHTHVVDKGGRGAGGACLPKDFAAFTDFMKEADWEPEDCTTELRVLETVERLNESLLRVSGKDPEIVAEVYGDA